MRGGVSSSTSSSQERQIPRVGLHYSGTNEGVLGGIKKPDDVFKRFLVTFFGTYVHIKAWQVATRNAHLPGIGCLVGPTWVRVDSQACFLMHYVVHMYIQVYRHEETRYVHFHAQMAMWGPHGSLVFAHCTEVTFSCMVMFFL